MLNRATVEQAACAGAKFPRETWSPSQPAVSLCDHFGCLGEGESMSAKPWLSSLCPHVWRGVCLLAVSLPWQTSSAIASDRIQLSSSGLVASGGLASGRGWTLQARIGEPVFSTSIATRHAGLAQRQDSLLPEGARSAPGVVEASEFSLGMAIPTPITSEAQIAYSLPDGSTSVSIAMRIFDLSGRLVRSLDAGARSGGLHRVIWNARDDNGEQVNAGIYFCHLDAGRFHATTRLVVIR